MAKKMMMTDPEKKKKGESKHEYRTGRELSMASRDKQSVSRDYSGQPAPRAGGSAQPSSSMASGTSKKSMIRKSMRNIRSGGASKAAKKAAIRMHKRKN